MEIAMFNKAIAVVSLLVMLGGTARASDIKTDNSVPVRTEAATELPAAALMTGEEINWDVVASGGDMQGSSTSYNLSGTVGQTAIGPGASANYGLNHGFWQNFSIVGASCVPGDADASAAVDIDDVVYLIAYIFSGGPAPAPAVCCGDADASGGVDIDDVVYLIAYIFSSGPAPLDGC
jgi:hypothetical protein